MLFDHLLLSHLATVIHALVASQFDYYNMFYGACLWIGSAAAAGAECCDLVVE